MVMKNINWKVGAMVMAIIMSGMFLIAVSGAGAASKSKSKNTAPVHSKHYHIVDIKNMVFSPSKLSISTGDTVVWSNSDNVPHMVNASISTEFQSPLFNQGQTFQHVFPKAGNFDYRCAIHPTMTGSITVK
jgi:plastocyanin